MFKQMYHIATSKIVVLDGYCILISILKHKKDLKVIQLWHALGSLKKFGYSSLDKRDGRGKKIADLMNMHKNYSYILTSSEVSRPFFREAFNAKDEQMVVTVYCNDGRIPGAVKKANLWLVPSNSKKPEDRRKKK